jgi:cold-inducible RNA-binding protein
VKEDFFRMKLYVGNLSYNTSEDELRDAFAQYGEVASAKIITDRDTGRSKGFGFIEFSDDESAKRAMSSLNGTDLGGRNLTVNEARPQTDRPKSGMGGGRERNGGGYRGGNRY